MVGHRYSVEPCPLGSTSDLCDRIGAEELVRTIDLVGRQPENVAHILPTPS
jgi:hypothetical protein